MNSNYSIVIQWSQKDNCFVASLPEWGDLNTYGKSYEQALNNARRVLSSLIEASISQGRSLPEAQTYEIPSVAQ